MYVWNSRCTMVGLLLARIKKSLAPYSVFNETYYYLLSLLSVVGGGRSISHLLLDFFRAASHFRSLYHGYAWFKY